jgi:hypothetical protein
MWLEKSLEISDCGIPPLRKKPRKDGASGNLFPNDFIVSPKGKKLSLLSEEWL